MLQVARAAYQELGALAVEPAISNRRIYASHEDMLSQRTVVGTWQRDEPYHEEEVLVFREFDFYKHRNPDVIRQRPDETSVRKSVECDMI